MKRQTRVILTVSLLVLSSFIGLFGLVSENAKADTWVEGHITVDTTWNLTNSPFIVSGDVYVDEGVTLTIEAGVTVKFGGYFSIIVNGNLSAIGTDADKITFTSNNPEPAHGDWGSIKFAGDTNEIFEMKYCKIEYADNGITISSASTGDYVIENCEIAKSQGNGIYIERADNSRGIIKNNNMLNYTNGIYFRSSSSTLCNIYLEGNTLSEGRENGFYLYAFLAAFTYDVCIHNVTIISNTINSNAQNGVYLYAYAYRPHWGAANIYNINITNNTITSNTQNGIYLRAYADDYGPSYYANAHIYNINIMDNTIHSNTENGVYLYAYAICDSATTNIYNVNISGNTVNSNTQNGIYLYAYAQNYYGAANIYSVNITNNSINSNTQNGIYLYTHAFGYVGKTYTYNVTIRGNNVNHNIQNGTSLYAHAIGTYTYIYIYSINITDNTVSNNMQNGVYLFPYYESYYGNHTYIHSINITNSTITNNYGTGIASLGSLEIHYCDIRSNREYGIYNYASEIQYQMNATYCWWGSADGPSGAGPGSGDNVSANVIYDPWLTEPVEGAGALPWLSVSVNANPTTVNSSGTSTITVTVTDGTNTISGASISLTSNNGGSFSPQTGTTNSNGVFTSTFTAPTVTAQTVCRITAQATKTGYIGGSGYVDVSVSPAGAGEWQYLTTIDIDDIDYEVWIIGDIANAQHYYTQGVMDLFLLAVSNMTFKKNGFIVTDWETILKGVSVMADYLMGAPSDDLIMKPTWISSDYTSPQLVLSKVESIYGGLQLLDVLDGSILSNCFFADPNKKIEQLADCIIKAIHHYHAKGDMTAVFLVAMAKCAMMGYEIHQGDYGLDAVLDKERGLTLGNVANWLLDFSEPMASQLTSLEFYSSLKLVNDFMNDQHKIEIIRLNELKTIKQLCLDMGYASESDIVFALTRAIDMQETITKGGHEIILKVQGEALKDALQSVLEGWTTDIIQDLFTVAAGSVSGFVSILYGISAGKILATVGYSQEQFEHSIDCLLLAYQAEEINLVIRQSTIIPNIVKRMLHSFGRELAALGYSYAAEGKGAFLFGAGNWYSDVNKIRQAAGLVYSECWNENRWMLLLSKYEKTFTANSNFVPELPEILVVGFQSGNILSNVKTKPLGGWREDWTVNMSAVVKIYRISGETGYTIIFDPIMTRAVADPWGRTITTNYRDTGVIGLNVLVNPPNSKVSSDTNLDYICGDPLCFRFNTLPSSIEIGFELLHGDGSIDYNSVTLDIAGAFSLLETILNTFYTIIGVSCPVNLTITNTAGKRIGVTENGTFINEIPNATAVAISENKIYYVPANDNYTITVSGYANGTYTLYIITMGDGWKTEYMVVNTTVTSGISDVFWLYSIVDKFSVKLGEEKNYTFLTVYQTANSTSALLLQNMTGKKDATYTYEIINKASLGNSSINSTRLTIDINSDGTSEHTVDLHTGMTGKDVESIIEAGEGAPGEEEEGGIMGKISKLPWLYIIIPVVVIIVLAIAAISIKRRKKAQPPEKPTG